MTEVLLPAPFLDDRTVMLRKIQQEYNSLVRRLIVLDSGSITVSRVQVLLVLRAAMYIRISFISMHPAMHALHR